MKAAKTKALFNFDTEVKRTKKFTKIQICEIEVKILSLKSKVKIHTVKTIN